MEISIIEEMSIITELKNFIEFIPDLIEDETVEYAKSVIKSYDNNYSADEIFENLYFKEFRQILETMKQQLKEKGIDYNVAIGEQVANNLFFQKKEE